MCGVSWWEFCGRGTFSVFPSSFSSLSLSLSLCLPLPFLSLSLSLPLALPPSPPLLFRSPCRAQTPIPLFMR